MLACMTGLPHLQHIVSHVLMYETQCMNTFTSARHILGSTCHTMQLHESRCSYSWGKARRDNCVFSDFSVTNASWQIHLSTHLCIYSCKIDALLRQALT